MSEKPPLLLKSMQGLGDGIHQRAAIRWHLDQGRQIWLQDSPWPELYEDFLATGRLHLTPATCPLRTQAKNIKRAQSQLLYDHTPAPPLTEPKRLWYHPHEVRQRGSVLRALLASAGCPDDATDFRFTHLDVHGFRSPERKPIMIFRPLIERPEWAGCAARNPDHDAYRAIFQCLRPHFHVISVADLEDGKEWLADKRPIDADEKYHAGEMTMPQLLRLIARAALVLASPGFAIPMAQSVGTPVVCVFGGYEDGRSFSSGAKWAPYLAIEPIRPCSCWQHHHACDKRIDINLALAKLSIFVGGIQRANYYAPGARQSGQLVGDPRATSEAIPQPG